MGHAFLAALLAMAVTREPVSAFHVDVVAKQCELVRHTPDVAQRRALEALSLQLAEGGESLSTLAEAGAGHAGTLAKLAEAGGHLLKPTRPTGVVVLPVLLNERRRGGGGHGDLCERRGGLCERRGDEQQHTKLAPFARFS